MVGVSIEHDDGVTVEYSATTVSASISVAVGLVAVILGGLSSLLALLVGLFGLVLLAGSVFSLESRRGVSLGAFGIFTGVVTGGVFGTPAQLLLPAMVATIVAWDVGHNAIVLGRQLGSGGFTRRLEFVHAGMSLLVGVTVAGIAYVLFAFSVEGVPAAGVILLLLATGFLAWSIRS